ncbi:ABC transporter permease [Anaeromicropila populeti]|uniref:ABC-2 type transport system permease protein n=1 Tax=Anaeromicropila populeti TaxID=37658 RepID=A0A1I6JCN2_9FIRM|nr:ABC transporter permease [Anaeromicropila populeti]SFR76775.1 ABC-2 type transport system permease protein [Anaeromicropila populeti]
MKAYITFTKKEFKEMVSTYRLWIMIAVFLLLGLINPVTAKITPELLKNFQMEGVEIIIAEPGPMDSWMQFFRNIPQMGLVVLVILFSGIVSNEFVQGTLVNMVTKGLSRKTIILSKFTMTVVVWTGSYLICYGVSYSYTEYFWGNSKIDNLNFSVFCLWAFGVILIASLILGGVLFRKSYGSLLFTAGFAAILFTLGIVPKLSKYNPILLASKNMSLLQHHMQVQDFISSIMVTGVGTVLFVVAAVLLFNKKEL